MTQEVADVATHTIDAIAPSGGYAIIALVMVVVMAVLLIGGAVLVGKYVFGRIIPILEKMDNTLTILIEKDKVYLETITHERMVSKQCFEELKSDLNALKTALDRYADQIKNKLER